MGSTPEVRRPVRIGVLLAPPPEDLGEWLADAAAFDAAGAHALWLDLPPEARLDPLTLAAGLATMTFRALLVTAVPPHPDGPRVAAAALATVNRLSRGRLALSGDRARLAEVTGDASERPGVEVFHRLDGTTVVRTTATGEPERWTRTPSPDGRAAWQAAITQAAEDGVGGLLVPAGPRLLDILRNPDDRGDRRDLQLAQG